MVLVSSSIRWFDELDQGKAWRGFASWAGTSRWTFILDFCESVSIVGWDRSSLAVIKAEGREGGNVYVRVCKELCTDHSTLLFFFFSCSLFLWRRLDFFILVDFFSSSSFSSSSFSPPPLPTLNRLSASRSLLPAAVFCSRARAREDNHRDCEAPEIRREKKMGF